MRKTHQILHYSITCNWTLDQPAQLCSYCMDDRTALALLGLDSRRSKLSTFLESLPAAWPTCTIKLFIQLASVLARSSLDHFRRRSVLKVALWCWATDSISLEASCQAKTKDCTPAHSSSALLCMIGGHLPKRNTPGRKALWHVNTQSTKPVQHLTSSHQSTALLQLWGHNKHKQIM